MELAELVSLTEGPFFAHASWNNKGSYVTFKMQLLCCPVDDSGSESH